MLKVPEWTLWSRNKPLQPQSVKKIIDIFSQRIIDLGMTHKNTTAADSRWLYAQPAFTQTQTDKLNIYLKKFWLKVSGKYRNLNGLVCYRWVTPHIDDQIDVRDHSVMFIPLYGHKGATFEYTDKEWKKIEVPIDDGSIVVFDHNYLHGVKFPLGNNKLKYGLSFFLDKVEKERDVVIQSPPSASSHPQDPRSP